MIPTMLVGDWLFVNKLVYGPHVPFTHFSLPGYGNPQRGDIVVFESPYQADEVPLGEDPTPTLVKRLIGMPGDTLYGREGIVYVNGLAQRQGYTSPEQEKGDPNREDPDFDWQKKVGLKSSRFGAAPVQPKLDTWGPFVVPPGHYWMMGDNRYNSKDSRYLGLRAPRECARASAVRVLLVRARRGERSCALVHHGYPVEPHRALDQVKNNPQSAAICIPHPAL